MKQVAVETNKNYSQTLCQVSSNSCVSGSKNRIMSATAVTELKPT